MTTELKIRLLTALLMSGGMAFVFTGIFSWQRLGFSIDWPAAWALSYLMIWPLAFGLAFLLGPPARKLATRLVTR